MPWSTGVGDLGNLSLTDYVRQLIPEGNDFSRVFCNSTGVPTKPPILRYGVPNTIIVFPGHFNPPHANHLQLLRHVVRNAGQDLNIIGAVVCIIDEDEVRQSLEDDGEEADLVLCEEERAELWAGVGLPVDWVWIHNSYQCDWKSTRSRLAELANGDGFDLRFLMLCGPEHFSLVEDGEVPENPNKWGCEGWITSDAGRHVDFELGPNAVPPIMSVNCTQWMPNVPIAKDVRDLARSKFIVNGLEDLWNLDPVELREEERRITETAERDWVCRYNLSPFMTVRFVIARRPDRPMEVTSSEIRRLIRCIRIQHIPALEPALASLVLHVRCLLRFAVSCREESVARQFDWWEYKDNVESRLQLAVANGNFEGVGEDGEPDEEALYLADMENRNYALQDINIYTRLSAIRSTMITHASGSHFLAQSQPSPYDLWGGNTYLNEPETPPEGEAPAEWVPTYEYELPEV